MRITTLSLLCVTIVIIAILQSCIKQPERGRRLVPPENLRLFGYKPGTWWVFQDSISGIEDSFSVKQFKVEIATNGTYDNQYALIDINRYNLLKSSDSGIAGMQLSSGGSISFYIDYFNYPFTKKIEINHDDTVSQLVRPTFNYDGKNYKNVLEQSHTMGTYIPNDTVYWHSHRIIDTGVGFLVVDIDNHIPNYPYVKRGLTAWRLKRWHIVR